MILGLDFSIIIKYLPLYGKGVLITILLSLFTIIFGSIIGFFLSLATISNKKYFSIPAKAYISFIRGTPLLIQIYIFAYGIPMAFPSLNLGVVIAAMIGLSLNSVAYVAEIFRSGIQAVDKGQFEAGYAMGYSKMFVMRKIVLPQAIKNALPSIGNEFVTIVKESSIVSVLGILDLTRVADLIKADTLQLFEALLVSAVLYFAITFPITKLIQQLERRLRVNER